MHNQGISAAQTQPVPLASADNRPLRVKDVAKLLDVHVSTVYREIEAGRLPALRLGAGRGTIRIPRSALAGYLTTIATEADADEGVA